MALIPDYPLEESPDNDTLFAIDDGAQTKSLKLSKILEFIQANISFPTPAQQVPTGSVLPYAGFTGAPAGFLECRGQTVSRTTYADLYAKIGVAHGEGDGSTTFHLPDYRGRFLRGVDDGANRDPDRAGRTASNTGGNSGDNVGSVQDDQYKSHFHRNGARVRNGEVNMWNMPNGSTANPSSAQVITRSGGAYTDVQNPNSYSAGGNETRPKNSNVLYIIKT